MSITCPTCGYDRNPDNAEFCDACGAELTTAISAPAQSAPSTPAPNSPQADSPEPVPDIIPIVPPAPPAADSPPQADSPEPVFTPPPAPSNTPPTPVNPVSESSSPATSPATSPVTSPAVPSPDMCLIAKQTNAPQTEFPLNQVALVGIFDTDSGPVDIDLESFIGGETVSRHHAEIYPEGGIWMVKDLGSTNGVFIKPQGERRFTARITVPTPLNPGDEVAFGKVQFFVKAA